ncbi:hypothetical protein [Catenuloplanes indicus]|uniref:Uncharacterized protein n=1 Tax=Catenuloplanes indicus TaxID=137267 RepID=A0AAE3W564_9ACTN|nr:hypothetical protein [Catenuloplanes indicus]MDQ0370058.1 hypothetical protein [Catenuloplanes indicus]
MSGITPYLQGGGNAADACRDAAADIAARLGTLRSHLAGLDADRLRMPPSRLADLLAGYDIYARMLDDALHDIAVGLQRAVPAPRRSDVELAGGEYR